VGRLGAGVLRVAGLDLGQQVGMPGTWTHWSVPIGCVHRGALKSGSMMVSLEPISLGVSLSLILQYLGRC
jgi:hypothetical protein